MSYRFVDHTAELQLELEAPTRELVLRDAVLALAELLGPDERGERELATRAVSVSATDDAALLAAWIDEIVFLAESEGLLPRRAAEIRAAEGAATGSVTFARGAPRHLVKGVTYHDLVLAPGPDGWRGRVVLDV